MAIKTKISMRQAAIWNLKKLGLLRPYDSPVATVEALVAVQAQHYPSVKRAIDVRTACAHNLDDLISYGGSLVRLWTLRGTLHIVPAQDAQLHIAATCDDWMNRWGRYLEKRLFVAREVLQLEIYPCIREVLSSTPLNTQQIGESVQLDEPYITLLPHLLKEMCYLGLVVRGPQGKGRAQYLAPWYQSATEYTTEEAQMELIGRFIASYGPVTYRDIAYWTGFKIGDVHRAITKLSPILTAVDIEGHRTEAYMLHTELDELCEINDAMVLSDMYLPAYDVLLLAYKDKQRFLDEAQRQKVFLSAARVCPVYLKDGRVAGVWNEKSNDVEMF